MTPDNYLKQFKSADVESLLKNDKCDKVDYLIAAGCSVIGGIVDIIVGS